ncbi:hypothetical protein ACLOJK_019119, partial [Asimina triloba]
RRMGPTLDWGSEPKELEVEDAPSEHRNPVLHLPQGASIAAHTMRSTIQQALNPNRPTPSRNGHDSSMKARAVHDHHAVGHPSHDRAENPSSSSWANPACAAESFNSNSVGLQANKNSKSKSLWHKSKSSSGLKSDLVRT